jgi:hypothetical protein
MDTAHELPGLAPVIEHEHSLRWKIAVLLITIDEGRRHGGWIKKVHDDE